MHSKRAMIFACAVLTSPLAIAEETKLPAGGGIIPEQRAALAADTVGRGFGPQSPRDIDMHAGRNHRFFAVAPDATEMSLCDIHFHKNAEHKGGEFTVSAGTGDGKGFGTGFKYNGKLSEAELKPIDKAIGSSEQTSLVPGDTIEIHFVYSTAKATIGHGLGTCLSSSIKNPQLRVEAVVAVLVNDANAADFTRMAQVKQVGDLNQAPNLPVDLGNPVIYEGSTTGPDYNTKGSSFEVTWRVRPKVVKVDINSVERWLENNPFSEDHAHGVRNLVVNLDLLSPIE